MKLGKLFKAIVKTAVVLPASVVADVATMGASKFSEPDGEFFAEKAVNDIAEDLDEITD